MQSMHTAVKCDNLKVSVNPKSCDSLGKVFLNLSQPFTLVWKDARNLD